MVFHVIAAAEIQNFVSCSSTGRAIRFLGRGATLRHTSLPLLRCSDSPYSKLRVCSNLQVPREMFSDKIGITGAFAGQVSLSYTKTSP